MTIDKIKVQPTPPKSNCLMWAQPNGDTVDLKINIRGKWMPVSGGASSSENTKIIVNVDELSDNFVYTDTFNNILKDAGLASIEESYNMSPEERETWRQNVEKELNDKVTMISSHGEAEKISFDGSSYGLLFKDGSCDSVYGGYSKYRFTASYLSGNIVVIDLFTGSSLTVIMKEEYEYSSAPGYALNVDITFFEECDSISFNEIVGNIHYQTIYRLVYHNYHTSGRNEDYVYSDGNGNYIVASNKDKPAVTNPDL